MDEIVFKHVKETTMDMHANIDATVMKHKFAIMCVDVYKKRTRVKMSENLKSSYHAESCSTSFDAIVKSKGISFCYIIFIF